MNQNNKWNEIQSILKKCHSDLKKIEKNLTTLEQVLQISKKKIH
ncbi:hypothetical protein [Niallia sp.]|nr:hypothetical protein [Niallia sp.]